MSLTSIGDQSQLFLTRRQTTSLRGDLTRLSQELASGKLVNPATRTTGDTAHLIGIGRSLTALTAYRTANAEAAHFTAGAQTALGGVQDLVSRLGPALAALAPTATAQSTANAAQDARGRFASVVGTLNLQVGGRSVFAGIASDQVPLASAEAILTALQSAIAGQTDAAGIATAIDDWFSAPGGGFETLAYQGGPGAPTFRLAAGEDAGVGTNASAPEVRAVLKGLALAALADAPGLAGNLPEQSALLSQASTTLIAADTGLTALRATLGTTEARIETMGVRQTAERTALELAEARFSAADPYETASAFQEVSTQLETLYAVTARLSRLNLAEYLR